MVRRFAAAPYGTHRSIMMSRGRGGAAGRRSIITERGGTGSAASRRMTKTLIRSRIRKYKAEDELTRLGSDALRLYWWCSRKTSRGGAGG